MERLPFDPAKVAGPQPDPGPALRERALFGNLAAARALTVSQASELIQRTLEERIPSPLRVVGEVSNFNPRNHWYFSLKDESAVLSCVAWATSARKLGFTPRDGQQVLATGNISHFAPQGRTQFYVSALSPMGDGVLEAKFRALCEELRGLGYFAPERKRPLPVFPRRVAVITSRTGAALQDVLATARQRCSAVGLVVVDVRVQGEGAAEQIARAIKRVNRMAKGRGIDAILVTRGGGSIEDLWAFNERIVADATFQSALPIVAAIGHESDTTIIELVADLRAATPTQAAMRLIPSRDELCRHLDHLVHRSRTLLVRMIQRQRERIRALARTELMRAPRAHFDRFSEALRYQRVRLSRAARARMQCEHIRLHRLHARLEQARPARFNAARRERLAVLSDRLRRAGCSIIPHRRTHLSSREERLEAIEVGHVLRRGYSYAVLEDGRILRSIREVRPGDPLATHVADGIVRSQVDGAGRRIRRGGSKAEPPSEQLDLFNRTG
jgi:exodeoxyribonuclease VII large subunit